MQRDWPRLCSREQHPRREVRPSDASPTCCDSHRTLKERPHGVCTNWLWENGCINSFFLYKRFADHISFLFSVLGILVSRDYKNPLWRWWILGFEKSTSTRTDFSPNQRTCISNLWRSIKSISISISSSFLLVFFSFSLFVIIFLLLSLGHFILFYLQ